MLGVDTRGNRLGRRQRVVELAVAVAAIRAFEERRAARLSPGDGAAARAWGTAGRREAHASRQGSRS